MKTAASVIVSIAKGSSIANRIIVDQFLPLLIQQLTLQSTVNTTFHVFVLIKLQDTNRQLIVEVILNLIQTFKPFSQNSGTGKFYISINIYFTIRKFYFSPL